VAKQKRIIDWKEYIYSDPDVLKDFIIEDSALKKVIELNIKGYLTNLLFFLEKESIFKSYFN
jgi:hypothetical protein